MTIDIKAKIRKAKSIYDDAHKDVLQLESERNRMIGIKKANNNNTELSEAGKKKRNAYADEELRNNYNARKAVMNRVSKELASIRTEIESEYYESMRTATIDSSIVSLMERGLLRYEEYMYYGDKYLTDGNIAMCRLIGTYARKASENKAINPDKQFKLVSLAIRLERANETGMVENFDNIAHACMVGLGERVLANCRNSTSEIMRTEMYHTLAENTFRKVLNE